MTKKRTKITGKKKSDISNKLGPEHVLSVDQKIIEKMKQLFLTARASAGKITVKIKPGTRSALKAVSKLGLKKSLIILAVLLVIVSSGIIKHFHTVYYGPNAVAKYRLFIREGDTFDQIVSRLSENNCLTDPKSFRQVAKIKDYDLNIRPGAYIIEPGWSNNQIINILRSGAQTPVMVTFNNIRTREELAGKLARQLESDSVSFLAALKNDSTALKLGFKPETLPGMFIPNTYSFYWTTSPAGFLTRMKREYDSYWNEDRKLKAKNLGLTADQVATLASIVQEESNKNDEKPIIAGVYLNRLRKSWPLQADPTIRFALGDFTIKRVLTAQLSVESLYNTYKNIGLPPGPINFPEISSLEAILNCKMHDFFYFCAKEDFSGYHNFAKTLSEHNANARKYQAALNKMKIFK